LQRFSSAVQAAQAFALQVVAPSDSLQSAAVEHVSQSVKPVRSLLHICNVLVPAPPH
jgi:hypothetical protein